MLRIVAAGTLLLATSGCGAIRAAQMTVPSDLAAAEPMRIEGIGHGTRGDFRVGGFDGRFTRSEERLALFDVAEQRSGHVSFALDGGVPGASIEADCTMRERSARLGVLSFTPERMAFGCDFTAGGDPIDGWLELEEVRHRVETLMRERRGAIAIGDTRLSIRSVHRMQGAVIDATAPIGYVFEHGDRVVGAVDLNGAPRLRIAPGADAGARQAVLAASVALALFWDPANSSLPELGDG